MRANERSSSSRAPRHLAGLVAPIYEAAMNESAALSVCLGAIALLAWGAKESSVQITF